MKQENVLDETYRKAGKMDSECFSPMLNLFRTDLMRIVREYLLEGTRATKGIMTELYKLNVYSTHLIFILLHLILLHLIPYCHFLPR